MQDISQYWEDKNERAQLAYKHLSNVICYYTSRIQSSIRNSKVYMGPLRCISKTHELHGHIKHTVIPVDSVTAIFDTVANHPGSKIAVLNFASYKHPGGAFLQGSCAQEESLCHKSTLYPVLDSFRNQYYKLNRTSLNRSLYMDRAIYSPWIVFFQDNKRVLCDVLTCAAPNFRAASRIGVTENQNLEALQKRIRFIFQILAEQHVTVFVAGAYGCGVFGQNPAVVAELFRKCSKEIPSDLKEIVYAIPEGRDSNLKVFRQCFEN